MPPLCAVSAGGLEPCGSGGRPMAPSGFQSELTCTPESGRAPLKYMLAQKRSTNHEHSRGTTHKPFILSAFRTTSGDYRVVTPESKFFCIIVGNPVINTDQADLTSSSFRRSEVFFLHFINYIGKHLDGAAYACFLLWL